MQNDKVKFKIAEKILVAIILTTIVFSPVLYLIRFSILGIPTTVLEIAIYLLFTFYFSLFSLGKVKFFWPDRKWLWPVGLLVLGAVIGVIISPDQRIALGQLKGFFFDPILLALIIFNLGISNFRSANWRTISKFKILNYLVLSGVWLSIWAIGQKLIGQTIDGGRVLSVYMFDVNPSPNYLALYLAPITAMVAVFLISKLQIPISNQTQSSKSKIQNYLSFGIRVWGFNRVWMLVFGVLLWAIIASGSRGGLLAVLVGFLVGVIILIRNKILKVALTSLTILTVLTPIWLARPDLSASPDAGRVASSNNIRWEIWKTTTEIITENPRNFLFGIGLGNYQNYFTQLTKDRVNYPEFIAPKALTPHNIFLAMWVNLGLLGLVAFIWILVLYFQSLLESVSINSNIEYRSPKQIQNSKNQNFKHFEHLNLENSRIVSNLGFRASDFQPAPLVGAMVALLVHGLVDTPYFKNDLSVEFWLLVSIAMITSTTSKKLTDS